MLEFLAKMRQLGYPREFRIDGGPLSSELLSGLKELAATLRAIADQHSTTPLGQNETVQLRLLCDLATGVWRLKYRMIDRATERPKEQFRREYQHVESLWDVLSETGIEIQDHTGQRVSPGQSLKEIERIPTQDLAHARVQETVKPTIYYKGDHVQRGEVIVEVPLLSKEHS